MTWKKNCKRCTRWRPLIDFKHVVHRRGTYGEKVYVRHVCEWCERVAHTASSRLRRDDFDREYARITAAKKRRDRGAKQRESSGMKTKRDQDRVSKARARRKAGVPLRPIGKRNSGKYGGLGMA